MLQNHDSANIPTVPTTSFKIGIIIGILIGGVVFLMGFLLCILGVTGSMNLIVESVSVKAKLINATPGAIFALLGFLILWRYRPKKSRIVYKEVTRKDNKHNGTTERKIELEQSDEAMIVKANNNPFER